MATKLRLALVEAGIPQYELARRAGMTETRLSRLARGRLRPTQEERERLAQVLERQAADLFPEERGPT